LHAVAFRIDPVQHADGPHAWRLTVTGDLDASTTEAFDETMDDVVAGGGRLVVLDLAGVGFLDSTGLRAIVRASNTLAAKDGRLTVAGLSGAAERVLELTGVLERLKGPGTNET
jgi:anti-sigma B factor antagonist